MSLLIKALQKAEQSKGAAVDNGIPQAPQSPGAELELTPDHDLDDTHSLHEESGFAEVATPKPKSSAAAQRGSPAKTEPVAPQHTPQAAANLFKAKEDMGGGDHTLWLAIGGVAILLLGGGGFYYYLNSLQQPTLVMANRPPPNPIQQAALSNNAPTSAPAEPTIVPPAPMPEAVPAAVADTPAPTPPLTAAESLPKTATEPPTAATEKLSARESVTAHQSQDKVVVSVTPKSRKSKPAVEKNDSVKVTRNRVPERPANAIAMSAYQAFMAGDDASAGRLYRQAMQAEPRNVDVLLGLAAIAVRQDRPDEAEQYYMRALELEPRNAVAQAGLIGLMGQADPVNSESRLKNLLAQQSDSGFLHESLGNLYAEQGQWPSAQQSYFQAFHLEPSRAEYAFNLAISLDHLNKADIALNYYQRALELTPTQQGSLDKGQLETRISQLRQQINK